RERGLAGDGGALRTGAAMPARTDERDHDVVAGPDVVDPRPHLTDYAGRLVAVDRGESTAPAAVSEDDVAMADCAGGEVDRDLFDHQRLPERSTNRCLHTPTPLGAPSPRGLRQAARIESSMHQHKRSFIVVRPKLAMVSRWPTVCPR